MRRTISKATSYIHGYLRELLLQGQRTAIPREVLEKEGLTLDELGEYFYFKQGPFGLIHFLGIRKSS